MAGYSREGMWMCNVSIATKAYPEFIEGSLPPEPPVSRRHRGFSLCVKDSSASTGKLSLQSVLADKYSVARIGIRVLPECVDQVTA